MINTKTSLFLLFLSLLLFSGCGQGTFIQNINYHTGVKGIELKFMDASPPDVVMEDSTFPITFLMSNQGAFSLNGSPYKGRLYVTYNDIYLAQTVKQDYINFSLEGKSLIYPKGEDTYQFLPSFKAKKLLGQRESPKTKITATVYYPYKTVLSDNICLDTYSVNDARTKVCKVEDKTYDGQGAPIAITKLHFETQKQGLVSRPIIWLNIENKGSGSVIHPIPSGNDKLGDIKDLSGNISITATFSNETLICSPSKFKLVANQIVVRCYSNKGFGSNINYLTNLNVELGYVYKNSISKIIAIQKLNEHIEPLPFGSCDNPWETKIGRTCYDTCKACSDGLISCSQTFKSSNWTCIDGNILDGTAINTSNETQLIIKHSDCIHDEGYCGPTQVCCSVCSKIQKCSNYKTSKECEDNSCDLDPSCFWTGSVCKSSDSATCTDYKTISDCKDNPYDVDSECVWTVYNDWTPEGCHKCDDTKQLKCRQYADKETCENDPCNYDCKWVLGKDVDPTIVPPDRCDSK